MISSLTYGHLTEALHISRCLRKFWGTSANTTWKGSCPLDLPARNAAPLVTIVTTTESLLILGRFTRNSQAAKPFLYMSSWVFGPDL